MFGHILKYNLKITLRDTSVTFWIIIFPLLLVTLFKFAFSGIGAAEEFKSIPIGIINNEYYQNDDYLKKTMEALSTDTNEEEKTLDTQMLNKENAEELLLEDKIVGYIELDSSDINFITKNSGIDQTIIKGILDQYKQMSSQIQDIIKNNPASIQIGLLQEIMNTKDYISETSISKNPPDNVVIYFYSAIAMISLYGAFLGIYNANMVQADCTEQAKRNTLAPVSKSKYFCASILSSIICQFFVLCMMFAYMIFVLGIQFGGGILQIGITCALGSLCGIFFGTFMSSVIKGSSGAKIGISIAIILLFSFLSGMMSIQIKYYVGKYMPFLASINPVNLITDSLYSLYYYDTLDRIYGNWIGLGVIAAIFMVATILVMRRKKYASI